MRNKYNFSTGKRGFTIVELIIYAGILTIFLYVLTNMFTFVLDMQFESESTSAIVQDSRYILARLAYDIGRASSLVTPAALGDQTQTLVLTIGGSNYTYGVTNGNLILTDTAGSGALNSYGTTVSNISFRRYGNIGGKHSVRIEFTLASTTERTNGPQIRDYQVTLSLR
jgi:hypothetical protein